MTRMTEPVAKRMLTKSGLVALIGCGLVACGQTADGDGEMTAPTGSGTTTGQMTSSGATGASSVSPTTTNGSGATVSPSTTSSGVNPQTTTAPTSTGNTSTGVSPVNPVQPVNPGPSGGVNPVAPGSTGEGTVDPTTSTASETTSVPTGECGIMPTASISEAIATVGIVEFTSSTAVTSAKIEFTPAGGGTTITAPVDLTAPNYRTLLLGMKPDTMYTYKVIVNDSCASEEQSIATASIPLTVNVPDFNIKPGMSPGYYIVSVYGGGDQNVIIDGDGDIVWYGPVSKESGGFGGGGGSSRAKIDFESKYMWSLTANPACCMGSGGMNRVSMDGLDVSTDFPEVDKRHHDIAAVPGGIMTFMVHSGQCSAVVERSPDGTVKTIVADTSTLYPKGRECHPNSIHYHTEDDSYTMSDRESSLYVKFSRSGELLWQLGGANPKGPIFAGSGTWEVNHGHHMFMHDGKLHFLAFNNGNFGGNSVVREFELDEGTMMANEIWTYDEDLDASVMGEVQRLPNGNTLVAYTERGTIREVNAASETVGEFAIAGGQVGYVDYRPTLYGTPTKAKLDYKFEE